MEVMKRHAFGKVALKVVNARYSVSTWLWIIVSLFVSTFLLLTIIGGSAPGLEEFLHALPFNGYIWAGGLVLASLVKAYGMAFKREVMVRYGALVSFCLWTFGAVTFGLLGQIQAVVFLIAPIMIFNLYLYLVAKFRELPQA